MALSEILTLNDVKSTLTLDSPTGPSLMLKMLANGNPTIGSLAAIVAMAAQSAWWLMYLAILIGEETVMGGLREE